MCRSYSEMHSPMRYEVTIAKISGLRRPGARPPGPPGSINCGTSHLKYLFDTLGPTLGFRQTEAGRLKLK